MEIVPAILTSDPRQAEGWIKEAVATGKFKRVQVDFVDGEYAANKTFLPSELDIGRFSDRLKFDAHLMVVEKNIKEYAEGVRRMGYDRVIAQSESISRPEEFRALAVDIHTPVVAVERYLSKLEYLVMMAIEPGVGGQVFDPEVMEKIRQVNKFKRGFKICVDGGVQKEHLPELSKIGVDEVAVGLKRVLSW